MSLLDVLKDQQKNRNANDDLPLGNYTGTLKAIKQDTRGDYEVYVFNYSLTNGRMLQNTLFVNADKEKFEKQVAYVVSPFYEAGLVSDVAMEKAMDNLNGFFDYLVKQSGNTLFDLKLSETTNNKTGKTYRNVDNRGVHKGEVDTKKDPFAGSDVDVSNDDLPF